MDYHLEKECEIQMGKCMNCFQEMNEQQLKKHNSEECV